MRSLSLYGSGEAAEHPHAVLAGVNGRESGSDASGNEWLVFVGPPCVRIESGNVSHYNMADPTGRE